MLWFEVSAAARNKEVRALILQGIYNVADIRIMKIIFHNDLKNFKLAFQLC
jgi:hypothetical protein